MLFIDKYLFETSTVGMQFGAFLGIWTIVWIVDLIAFTVMLMDGPKYLHTETEVVV
jgi:hypothetical protein